MLNILHWFTNNLHESAHFDIYSNHSNQRLLTNKAAVALCHTTCPNAQAINASIYFIQIKPFFLGKKYVMVCWSPEEKWKQDLSWTV